MEKPINSLLTLQDLVCCHSELKGVEMDQFLQEEGERKVKTLKDQEEEELEETDLIEDMEAAPQENRIKDPVNRHSQNPNTL